ncbi:MAG TPA: geranylgeranylglycerol-phosphate geranylgeranyltransferase [Methanomicrobiales archaeon]|nr:geranylgeranylglycerol-phosphate geranylgeranyltransferase [Methanomicrobiales archaeon]
MTLAGLLTLMRPVNCSVAGLAALLGYVVATGTLTPFSLILFPIVFSITAGGNVFNDLCDLPIDRVNRPGRPLPSGQVTPREAGILALFLFTFGLALTIPAGPACVVIAVANSLLLLVYARTLKRMAGLGNVAVSYLSASIYPFGGALAGIPAMERTLPLAGITFLAMLSRELLKDAEDVPGDRAAGARTVPIVIGVKRTAVVAYACAIGAIVVSLLPVVPWWGGPYLAGIGVADVVILFGAARALRCRTPECVRASRSTTILKAGMYLALAVIAIAAVLSGNFHIPAS